ncbi:hypothetical protein GGX14DRAFT_451853 [Mycena pura]|uniref:Uncharacterized protein n=1 Tax=Mycena pura TaxID=153505 RepID=A0AAD6VKD2_9AGAR|nr:hypothetical protein GGX14DRAFT_451853 [Mycena pura]
MDMSTSVMNAAPVIPRRRKPLHTYQSPSAVDRGPTIVKRLSVLHNVASATTAASGSGSVTSSSPSTSKCTTVLSTGIVVRTESAPRKKYPMAPPLPLYHPLGRLALSLPPLDPAQFGHSVAISVDDSDGGRRSSVRSRRPAAKVRETDEDDVPIRAPISNVSAIAAVAAREIKEKASPRKRRGGGGGGVKRKRRDAEDGDATYPAKRTRNSRSAANTSGGALAEDGSPSDSGAALPEVTPTPEPAEAQDDNKVPERRSTRSGGSRRRDSSASDGTSRSASGTREPSKANGTDVQVMDGVSDGGKEEGEVSEG